MGPDTDGQDPLTQPDGTPIAITGLWDLTFGGGSPENGRQDELFFTAGFTVEDPPDNGLFGVITATGPDAETGTSRLRPEQPGH
jgi:hypothetical protein